MKQPYRLKCAIAPDSNMDPEDVWAIKKNLRLNGFYPEPDYGLTPYPDKQLFDSIRGFQKAKKLRVDGVAKPGGETEKELLKEPQIAQMTCCRHCGVLHGGIFHPYVCHDCWAKDLR